MSLDVTECCWCHWMSFDVVVYCAHYIAFFMAQYDYLCLFPNKIIANPSSALDKVFLPWGGVKNVHMVQQGTCGTGIVWKGWKATVQALSKGVYVSLSGWFGLAP